MQELLMIPIHSENSCGRENIEITAILKCYLIRWLNIEHFIIGWFKMNLNLFN